MYDEKRYVGINQFQNMFQISNSVSIETYIRAIKINNFANIIRNLNPSKSQCSMNDVFATLWYMQPSCRPSAIPMDFVVFDKQ